MEKTVTVSVKKLKQTWRNFERRACLQHDKGALIEATDYGAEIRFSDGRISSLWAYALSEPVMEFAVQFARRAGAEFILVESLHS